MTMTKHTIEDQEQILTKMKELQGEKPRKYIPKVGDIFKVDGRFEICVCLCTKNGIFASYDRIGRICFDPGAEFQHISQLSEAEIKELQGGKL